MDLYILKPLIDKGLSSRQIAKTLNCSQTNIRYWLKKYQIKTNKKNDDIIYPNNMKICRRCLIAKEYNKENFYLYKKTNPYCKPCLTIMSKLRCRNKKIKYLNYKGNKCVLCGYNKCPAAMHFHHFDPITKKFCISQIKNKTEKEIYQELDKCEIVCHNCHAEIHFKE